MSRLGTKGNIAADKLFEFLTKDDRSEINKTETVQIIENIILEIKVQINQ